MGAGSIGDQAFKRTSNLTAPDWNAAVWKFLHDRNSSLAHAVEGGQKGGHHPGQMMVVQNDQAPILPPHAVQGAVNPALPRGTLFQVTTV